MTTSKNKVILIVGAGPMAIEYAKVLNHLKKKCLVIGNKKASANTFFEATKILVVTGGIKKWLRNHKVGEVPKTAIVATPEETLGTVTIELLRYGVKNILVEKPGGLDWKDITNVYNYSIKKKARVYVAYNRRFYASVQKAMEIIKKDGGLSSFFFEFTEWSHIVSKLKKPTVVKNWWYLQNSTHVLDMAFFMGGLPQQISSFTKSHLRWHPKASIFTGAGLTKKQIPFSYIANWNSPGRWVIEMMTSKHRLIFKPLEKLQIQNIGSVEIIEEKIDNKKDLDFKPGVFAEVKSFLGDKKFLCTIKEQYQNLNIYRKILGDK